MGAKIHEYHDDRISVTWDGVRCIHAAECLRVLPEVFDIDQRPWVQPGKASADEVAEAVLRCPTGALHFTRRDGGAEEPKPAENLIAVEPDGPLYALGDVVMLSPENEVLFEDTRIALCRCGESKNKPFCDNGHRRSHFRDPGELCENRMFMDEPLPETKRLTITAKRNGSFRVQGPMTLYLADGTELTGNRCSLCRCGHSKIKPFCDGTHKTIGFISENSKFETQNSSHNQTSSIPPAGREEPEKECPVAEDE